MSKPLFRQDLLNSFVALQEDFNTALTNAKSQEQIFDKQCQDFQMAVETHLNDSISQIAQSNPLYTTVHNFKAILQSTNDKWAKDLESRDKGVKFREGFNDSLLVFVYGKVKSGKSSLGNYMAWGNTDPTDELKEQIDDKLQPKYFSGEKSSIGAEQGGDSQNEAVNNKEFRVGATEATSTIQGFSLPGLTWVDSPGLHSVNEQNGALAREYVKYSDLILYTMKSDSPGRESDLKEITDIYQDGKKMVLLITGSDTTEEDYDDEKDEIIQNIVMKPLNTRQDQQVYVKKALNDIPALKGGVDNIDIISFSARYAQLHDEQADEFLDSGMGQLFKRLHQIAQADGVKLKQKAPLQGFANFIKSFEKDLVNYENALNEFNAPLKKLQRDIPILVDSELRSIQRELSQYLDAEFDGIHAIKDKEQAVNQKLRQLGDDLTEKQKSLMLSAQTKIVEQVLSQMSDEYQVILSENSFFDIPSFRISTDEKRIEDSVTQGTRGRNSAIGTAIGAGIGFTFGGVGAVAGATIDGMVGSAMGRDSVINYRTIQIATGDNLSSIENAFNESIKESTKVQMQQFKTLISDSSLEYAEKLIDNINHEIDQFRQSIAELDSSINQTLSQ